MTKNYRSWLACLILVWLQVLVLPRIFTWLHSRPVCNKNDSVCKAGARKSSKQQVHITFTDLNPVHFQERIILATHPERWTNYKPKESVSPFTWQASFHHQWHYIDRSKLVHVPWLHNGLQHFSWPRYFCKAWYIQTVILQFSCMLSVLPKPV